MRGERSIGCDGAVIYPSTVCAVPPISEDAQWRCLTAQHEDVLNGGYSALIGETVLECIVFSWGSLLRALLPGKQVFDVLFLSGPCTDASAHGS